MSVWVIADNCTDDTAEQAKNAGAYIAVRNEPDQRGKGQALHWFLRSYADTLRESDFLVFLDADVTIATDYLDCLAMAFSSSTYRAVQSYNGVANPEENWRTALTYAGFAGVNHLRPLGQDRLFGGTLLKGTGMAFQTDVLLERGWPARSIVEDMEMTLCLAKEDIAVHYCPEAWMISRAESTAARADSQRRRWEGGRLQIMAQYVPRLAALCWRKPRRLYVGLLLELLTPPLSLLVLLDVIWVMSAWGYGWHWAAYSGITCLSITGFYTVAALASTKAPRAVWMALLKAPFFLIWKWLLYFGLIMHPEKHWVRTKRTVPGNHAHPVEEQEEQEPCNGPTV